MNVLTAQRHFWKWFELNSQAIFSMRTKTKKEHRFWINECRLHVALFCSPDLGLEIRWHPDGASATAIITAYGKEEHFEQAEAFVHRAPFIKEWTFLALYPPIELNKNIIKHRKLRGFDPFGLQFCPYDVLTDEEKYTLIVYVETQEMLSRKHNAAVFEIVYNLLGERICTMYIKEVVLSTFDEAPYPRRIALMPISDLVMWFEEPTNLSVNENGIIIS